MRHARYGHHSYTTTDKDKRTSHPHSMSQAPQRSLNQIKAAAAAAAVTGPHKILQDLKYAANRLPVKIFKDSNNEI
jgi:hypothetical protein